MLFDSGWEVIDFRIRKPGVFELANIETESCDHRLDAGNSQLLVHIIKVDLIGAVIADKEIRN